jgi:hypothetical protein
VIFVATKRWDNIFSPSSFVAVIVCRIRDPGWIKIRIRDKQPGSAALQFGTSNAE